MATTEDRKLQAKAKNSYFLNKTGGKQMNGGVMVTSGEGETL